MYFIIIIPLKPNILKKTLYTFIVAIASLLYTHAQNSPNLNIEAKKDSIAVLMQIGNRLENSKTLSAAENYYIRAFELAKKVEDANQISILGFRLVEFQIYQLKKYKDAEELLDYLLEYFRNNKDQNGIVKCYLDYGRLNQRKQHFVNALKHYNIALEKVEKSTNNNLHWRMHTTRGNLLRILGDDENALKDFKNALRYTTEETSAYNKSLTYINISSAFEKIQLDSCIYYSELAAFKCKPKTNLRHCNLAYNNLAWANHLKGNSKKALDIINANVDLSKIEYGNFDNLYAALMHTLGVIHLSLEDYDKAITHFETSQEYFEKRNDIFNIVQTKEDLSKAYEKVGKLQKSITTLREIKPYREVMDSLKVTRGVAKIESRKILELKEQKISKLEEENLQIGNKINRTKALSYCLGAFLIITMTVLLYRGYTSKIRFHQLNEELSMNRLKSLRSMMNPHFLFNSFSTLQNYILKKESLKANEYMAELSGLIRNVLSSSDSIYIAFKDELQILKSYISIEQERFNDSFEVVYTIDSNLIEENPTIPSMIIQPYIENAIIHGFSHLKNQGLLTITMDKGDKHIICKIKDNGIGRIKAEAIKKENKGIKNLSIATRNTNERLKILGKVSQRSASVEINDLYNDTGTIPKGTEVVIILPIQDQ